MSPLVARAVDVNSPNRPTEGETDSLSIILNRYPPQLRTPVHAEPGHLDGGAPAVFATDTSS
jgi:hypothetical protein